VTKSEAIKRGSDVQTAICSTSNGTSCASSTDWTTGWLVFVDADKSSAVSTGDTVLKVHEAVTSGIAITSPANLVVFQYTGFVSGGTGDFTVCNSKIKSQRKISINSVGRSRLQEETCT
jgi:type IV fimbrial biogenesis protein FimT